MIARKSTDKKAALYLRVPNDEQGREFIRMLRGYSAGGVRVLCRGRGARAKHHKNKYVAHLPKALAEHFAIYLRKPGIEEIENDRRTLLYREINKLNKEIRDMATKWDAQARNWWKACTMAERLDVCENILFPELDKPVRDRFRQLMRAAITRHFFDLPNWANWDAVCRAHNASPHKTLSQLSHPTEGQ